MKKNYFILKIAIVIIAIISISALKPYKKNDDIKYISIEKLIKDNFLKAELISKGGYQKECMNIHVENLTDDTLNVLLEPGRRLVSIDSSIQDIFIVKKRKIRLPPLVKFIIGGYGFCCQSSNGAPRKGQRFKIGYMAPEKWVKLAEFIDIHNFPTRAVQSAVWVMSNDHPVSSIHDAKPEKVIKLKKFVAKLKGVELPWYSLTYVEDTARLFSNKPEMLWGKIEYQIKNNTVITVNVRNEQGDKVKTLIDQISKGPGHYYLDVKLPVENWPRGKYFIYIIEDYANLNTKRSFKL
jgi:hypothetical protein